ncbi:AMP-binding protein [Streptomyces sp. SCSIO ZS0520]|uniref:AMP-binding protein n=1 Tax=Streptomyces sp. SCSIO ZS0520 TaxID=2892996 RepID=UPI0021DAD6CE|nr:AMP-binding protein [Streptomyces sp. SCSIO ZS0520]
MNGTDPAGERAGAGSEGLAVLHGPALGALPVDTLPQALRRAARTPHGMVLLDAEGRPAARSYAELHEDALRALAALDAAGVPPGARVVLQTGRSADLLTAFWACVLGGMVPLPVPHDGGRAALVEAADAVGRGWLLGDTVHEPPPSLHRLGPVTLLPGRARPVTVSADRLALLSLTSGSGGRPKAVALTHRQVLSRAHATALARGLDGATRSLNWMPLHHISGIVMFHVRDVFLGCHQVHADTAWVRADPLRWLDVAEAERIDTTWAPNHAFSLVVEALEQQGAGRSWDLSRLRYLMNGGQAVKDRTARRFLAALAPHGLPPACVHPGWGMPETASGVVDSVFTCGEGPPRRHVPVGVPHPGVSVRVVDEDERPLAAGTVGRLQVRGAPVADTYVQGGGLLPVPRSGDGWLVTDDLAFVAGGELTVTGRADGLIEVNGACFHGHEIEEAVEELPWVRPSFTVACAGADGPGDGSVAVFFCPRPGVPPRRAEAAVREQVGLRFGAAHVHAEALAEHELPRTATGKLRRSVLTARLVTARERGHRERKA